MPNTSLIARTVNVLKDEGYAAQRVEYFNPWAKKRYDLFGVGDVLGVKGDPPDTLLVQVTDGQHVGDHRQKIAEEPRVRTWLEAGNRMELWVWRKLLVTKSGRARKWEVRREEIK